MAGSRQTAEERVEEILRVATEEFARYGYHGASTAVMARRLEISQPYIFKLFGTKQALYLSALDRVYTRVRATFDRAARAPIPEGCGPLDALGDAFIQMLDERADLQLMLQGFAAAGEPEIQAFARREYIRMFEFLRETTGASLEETRQFLATGLLLTVIALTEIPPELFYPDYPGRAAG